MAYLFGTKRPWVQVPSPRPKIRRNLFGISVFFLLKAGLERLGSRNLTRGSSLRKKDCDQTTDGTVVCQTGVIANNGKEKQDERKARACKGDNGYYE